MPKKKNQNQKNKKEKGTQQRNGADLGSTSGVPDLGSHPEEPDGGASQFVSASLYVSNLGDNVTDSRLYDLFFNYGLVISVRVCRDTITRRSLGYGYVNFTNTEDAKSAMEELNFKTVDGKPIRISYYRVGVRKRDTANLFIKNLDKAIDDKDLFNTFKVFGDILSSKIATDSSGKSKGHGFIQFDNDDSAQRAIDTSNGKPINGKQVHVGLFLRKQERETAMNGTKLNNVYVKNLPGSATEEDLKKIFGEYGEIVSVIVMRNEDGISKCFGFVNFANADAAAKAIKVLHGSMPFDEKTWYVAKAQKKSERKTAKEAVDKFQGLNLSVKNLDESIDDEKLKERFSEFGTVTSCKVMRDSSGISRGSGFVAFSTAKEASCALAIMKGKMVRSKPLYVALAESKAARNAKMQAQFSQSATKTPGAPQ